MTPTKTASLLAALLIAGSSFAAKPSAGGIDPLASGLHLTSTLGSFKIKRGSEDLNKGVLEIHFTGTLLVSGLKGQAVPSGGVKLEYDRPDMDRKVFHGTGALHVDGEFSSILFFGQNVDALYNGSGVVQLFGEFDKDLQTGYYWYGKDIAKKLDWGTTGVTILPNPVNRQQMERQKIKVKNVTGQG